MVCNQDALVLTPLIQCHHMVICFSLSFQYSVTLQSEEVIAESCRQRASQKPMLVPYSKAHEVCLNLSHTHLLLPIPLHITPTFTTDVGESPVAEG